MRTIAHLSDLHFGRLDPAILPPLTAAIVAAKPDLIVVSGDLTQRARKHEFAQARSFLDALPFPRVVVPGNHDVPLYNVLARWLDPFGNYCRYISSDLEPFYADDEIAVAGVNTARSLTFKNGRINRQQVARSCARLMQHAPAGTRIVVSHHPLDLSTAAGAGALAGRAGMAVEAFAGCRVDLLLAGHLHASAAGQSAARAGFPVHGALLVQAGTATSGRLRGELNSSNLLRIERDHVTIERWLWEPTSAAFVATTVAGYRRSGTGWASVDEPSQARG